MNDQEHQILINLNTEKWGADKTINFDKALEG